MVVKFHFMCTLIESNQNVKKIHVSSAKHGKTRADKLRLVLV